MKFVVTVTHKHRASIDIIDVSKITVVDSKAEVIIDTDCDYIKRAPVEDLVCIIITDEAGSEYVRWKPTPAGE